MDSCSPSEGLLCVTLIWSLHNIYSTIGRGGERHHVTNKHMAPPLWDAETSDNQREVKVPKGAANRPCFKSYYRISTVKVIQLLNFQSQVNAYSSVKRKTATQMLNLSCDLSKVQKHRPFFGFCRVKITAHHHSTTSFISNSTCWVKQAPDVCMIPQTQCRFWGSALIPPKKKGVGGGGQQTQQTHSKNQWHLFLLCEIIWTFYLNLDDAAANDTDA